MTRSLCALLALFLTGASPAPRNVVLFLGDSLTAGYGVSAEEAYPALLGSRWKAKGLPLTARNAAVSGATTAGVLENLDWSLTPDVRLAFLAVGANDGLRGLSLAQSEANIDAMVAAAKKKGIPVVLAGMKIPPNYGKEYAGKFEAIYPRVARRHGLKLLPFLLEGVAGIRALNIEDGMHPNAAGHKIVAKRVGDFLDKTGLLR